MSEFALDFSGMLQRLRRIWRRIAINALLAGALVYGATFLLPTWYRSSTVLLPPEESDQMGGGLSVQRFLSRVPSLGSFSSYYSSSDIFRAILLSRSVHEAVIRRFDLQRRYKSRSMELALKEFRNHVRVELAPDGTITASVEDRSRQLAAQIANGLVEELDRFNVERRNTQAKRSRIFLERRLADTDSLSREAEAKLSAYQERHHVLAPVDAESQNLKPLADLMARKFALEVQLQVLESYLSRSNERVVQTRSELTQLKQQIANIPNVESELGRQMRDVRLYQQLFLLLSGQLEDARLRETMDVPTVTVLDPAVPSERRARPLRVPWAAAAAAAAALITAWRSEAGGRGIVSLREAEPRVASRS